MVVKKRWSTDYNDWHNKLVSNIICHITLLCVTVCVAERSASASGVIIHASYLVSHTTRVVVNGIACGITLYTTVQWTRLSCVIMCHDVCHVYVMYGLQNVLMALFVHVSYIHHVLSSIHPYLHP